MNAPARHLRLVSSRGDTPLKRGGMGVDETAKAMGVTRQRIDQIERVAMRKLNRKLNRKLREWRDY